MSDPKPDPVRDLFRSANKQFTVGDDPDREPTSATGKALVAALRAAGIGGTPMTDPDPKDAA